MTNSFSPQAFVPGYALDILEERAKFEGDLAASASLQAELTTFESAVGELAYGVPTVPLPRDLKGRLFSDLEVSEIDRLPSTEIELNSPQSPRLNRPPKGDIPGVIVGGKPR
jgi:hypothetical protein